MAGQRVRIHTDSAGNAATASIPGSAWRAARKPTGALTTWVATRDSENTPPRLWPDASADRGTSGWWC